MGSEARREVRIEDFQATWILISSKGKAAKHSLMLAKNGPRGGERRSGDALLEGGEGL